MRSFNEHVAKALEVGTGISWYPDFTGDSVEIEDLLQVLKDNGFHEAKFYEAHSFRKINRKVKKVVNNHTDPLYIMVHHDKTRCIIGYHEVIGAGKKLWIRIIGRNEQ